MAESDNTENLEDIELQVSSIARIKLGTRDPWNRNRLVLMVLCSTIGNSSNFLLKAN